MTTSAIIVVLVIVIPVFIASVARSPWLPSFPFSILEVSIMSVSIEYPISSKSAGSVVSENGMWKSAIPNAPASISKSIAWIIAPDGTNCLKAMNTTIVISITPSIPTKIDDWNAAAPSVGEMSWVWNCAFSPKPSFCEIVSWSFFEKVSLWVASAL